MAGVAAAAAAAAAADAEREAVAAAGVADGVVGATDIGFATGTA
jgi:hypothetical protein